MVAGLTSSRAQDSWTQKADCAGAERIWAVGFSIGNKGYVGTGYSYTSSYPYYAMFKDFWEYDPASDVWTQRADYGGGVRLGAVGFSIGSKGYIGTGLDLADNFYNDFWEYDPPTNVWSKKADFGGEARESAVAFSIGSKGYIGTGFDNSYISKNDFWEYDPATDSWTQKVDFGGTARNWAVGFSIDNKGYIGTGAADDGVKKDFWEYDPTANTWAQKADFGGSARYGAVGFSIGGMGCIGTGKIYDYGSVYYKDFWEYDPTINNWTQKSDFGGSARQYAIGFTIGSKAYLGTGSIQPGSFGTKDFWEYTPECNGGLTVYVDADADHYGNAANSLFVADCVVPIGYVLYNNDCNDADASVNPQACDAFNGNAIDDNCDGIIDNGYGTTTYYIDVDGDGYGTGNGFSFCTNSGAGYSTNNSDCNDLSVSVNLGASEIFNGIDDNCNGIIDEGFGPNTWQPKADFGGGARDLAVGFSIGNKGYIGTGWNGSDYLNDFWEYDPATNAWTQKADFGGVARRGAVGFSIGNKGYLGTGENTTNGYIRYKDFWEYNPATNTWVQKADFGGNERSYAVGFSIGSKGYIGTGSDVNGLFRKDFWEYNPSTNNWTQKSDFGGDPITFAVGFSIGNKGYIGTGNSSVLSATRDFWEYDPATNGWKRKAHIPEWGIYAAVGFSIGSKGYIGTGEGPLDAPFFEYDPASNSWKKKADFKAYAISFAVGFSIGDKGYIGTGHSGTYYNDFWQYTPGITTSCPVPSGMKSTNITSTSAKLEWDYIGDAMSYNLRYKIAGTNAWTVANHINFIKQKISGLLPNTLYYWEVNSWCAINPNLFSEWSEKQSFTTGTLKIEPSPTTTMRLYSNPVSENFTLDLQLSSASDQSATIYLLNTIGQVVYSSNNITTYGTLNKVITMPSAATSGWYVVRVVMNDQVLEQKLLYQK